MSEHGYLISGAALLWIAALVAIAGLMLDSIVQRFRRRRRCPKCWYDLSYAPAPGLTCSECGHTVKRERHLYKGRKRWSLVWLAISLALGGYALRVMPAMQQRGWVAAVPTTAIIIGLPWIEPSSSFERNAQLPRKVTAWSDVLCLDLLDIRSKPDALWRWQERLLVERCLRGDNRRNPPSSEWMRLYGLILDRLQPRHSGSKPWWYDRACQLVDIEVRARETWPINAPIYAEVLIRRWNDSCDHRCIAMPVTPGLQPFKEYEHSASTHVSYGSGYRDNLVLLGTPAERTASLEFKVDLFEIDFEDIARLVRTYPLQVPITLVESAAEVLTSVVDPQADGAIRDALEPKLTFAKTWDGRTGCSLVLFSGEAVRTSGASSLQGLTIGAQIELIHRGKPVAATKKWFVAHAFGNELSFYPWGVLHDFEWIEGTPPDLDSIEPDNWTVHFKSDANVALRNRASDRCWQGDLTIAAAVALQK